jgi:hypothetical protein
MTTPFAALEPIHIGPDGTIVDRRSPEEIAFLHGWQPSSHATTKDVEESRRVRKAITALPKQCWFNARRAILKLKDYAEASLIEGWAIIGGGMPIEHGWIVRDGLIIDPTLPTDPIEYFPGLEFRGRAEIVGFLKTPEGKKCKKTPFFYAFGCPPDAPSAKLRQ